jgi:hypothetical protein
MMGGPRRMGAMGMHPMMQRGVNGSPAQRAAGGVGDLAGAMGDMKLQVRTWTRNCWPQEAACRCSEVPSVARAGRGEEPGALEKATEG